MMDETTVTISWDGMFPVRIHEVEKKEMKKNNPYVPLEIHVDEIKQVMVVKWQDGTETKVTCDAQDNFSVDVGFGMAFTEHMFGGKSEFKEKWWEIIQRRIKYH